MLAAGTSFQSSIGAAAGRKSPIRNWMSRHAAPFQSSIGAAAGRKRHQQGTLAEAQAVSILDRRRRRSQDHSWTRTERLSEAFQSSIGAAAGRKRRS